LESSEKYYSKIQDFEQLIADFKWKADIRVEVEDFVQNNEILYLISVSLVNNTPQDRYETFLFNCNLEIFFGSN
jgi:hypothetical protein